MPSDSSADLKPSALFKAYDVRATYPDKLNAQRAYFIGLAAGKWYLDKAQAASLDGPDRTTPVEPRVTVLVSRDMRPHSPELCDALTQGLLASVDVVDLGMADTSFMYFAVPFMDGVNGKRVVGGIQTTASHNPIHYNGFKMSGEQARPIGQDTGLAEIAAIADRLYDQIGEDVSQRPKAVGQQSQRDLWPDYKLHVRQFFTPPKRPLKLFIDASNGMAGSLVPKVIQGLDNVEVVSINTTMGEGFAHEPNPLVAENMIPTQEGTREHGASLGACFDGDADRCMIVDDKGQTVGCDHLTALLAHHFAKDNPGGTIVYDLRSSKVVEETVRALGCKPAKSKVGHVNMKALLRETDAPFGGELSGHFYFRDNAYADSGAITLMLTLSVLGATDQPFSDLIAPFRKYPQYGEINFENDDKQGTMASLKETYAARGATVEELDGVSIDLWDAEGDDGGFVFNVRASNTEPLLRLNAEAKDQATLDKLLGELKPKLGTEAEGH